MNKALIGLALLWLINGCTPQGNAAAANIQAGLAAAQVGISAVQSSNNACDAIDNFAASAVATGASCKIKNALLNIQMSVATACALTRNPQSAAQNISTASIIILSALTNAQSYHAQGC
jgi:hypothetical protein